MFCIVENYQPLKLHFMEVIKMQNLFKESFNDNNRKTTLKLLSISFVLIILALFIGISDNPPGIILLYVGFITLILVFVHHWRIAKKYLFLFIFSFTGLFLFSLLHNVFHGLAKMSGDIIVLSQMLSILHVLFFLIALIVCPPGILVGAVGGIVNYFKNKKNIK